MAKLQVELVTPEGRVFSEEADFVLAPGVEGDLGVLPHHIALLTPLRTGVVTIRNNETEHVLAVAGGFLEILPDKVTILADAAERAEDIDEARADEARKRAQELLTQNAGNADAILALERATLRLQVADIRRRRHGGHPPAQ
jgi:F-type H+-transporting ATPase subunit epsilon